MSLPTTTMNDLIDEVKRNILLYKATTLVKCKTYKKGILAPITVFPAISIVPEKETLFNFQSGQQYKVNRRIRFDIYGFGRNIGSTLENTIELSVAIKDIMTLKHKWPNASNVAQCYNTIKVDEVFGDPYPYKHNYLQKSTITMECYSGETLPTQTLNVTPADDPADDFLSTVYDKVYGYKSTTLQRIKSFARGVTPPFKVYPALVVSENSEDPTFYEAGREMLTREMEFALYHKLLDKEGLLVRLMKEADNVKTIILTNPKWDGSAVWSEIVDIDYGVFTNENTYLYSVFITMNAMCKKTLSLCA